MLIIYLWILSYLVSSNGFSLLKDMPGFSTFESCIEPPSRCPNPNITFYLYTRNVEAYVLDFTKPESFLEAPFVLHAPIKLLIHGYTGHKDYSPNTELRPAYLRHRDLNVISVDYKELVQPPCYVQAVHNVPLVGKCTKMLLLRLFRLRPDLNLHDLHVIGFSLGAQVAGHVGRLMNSTIQRITGLDPASPLFDTFLVSNEVLDKSDAIFVDVVHTNIAFKGKFAPLGHLDFYANNAIAQPGCGTNTSCSHVRAVEYFAESIDAKIPFLAVKCISYIMYKLKFCKASDTNSLIVMGEHVDKSQRGIYYFMTNSEPQYAQGLESYGIKKLTKTTSPTPILSQNY
ncbi:Lipase/vitellogenin,Triacylglycerol lipase family,Lipase, N-terminal,Alpha/Beta hydrolase fold [Cinara cedri]|uniref:Lipase/vitellogenin,Triacylglycerol lipase family,Lipase, N-terminal,Alpha/Beta hydrolase fold n=1 Tax=Cinara cedri TaxID=506608 RepID=A0A5E4MZY7_9HEMI|nr:Lipase/vitellogenin,Triacylglycerol lipase family,Lipase, N-terminal,Alpha/Beta hydrolase fold [Cinara cedri]